MSFSSHSSHTNLMHSGNTTHSQIYKRKWAESHDVSDVSPASSDVSPAPKQPQTSQSPSGITGRLSGMGSRDYGSQWNVGCECQKGYPIMFPTSFDIRHLISNNVFFLHKLRPLFSFPIAHTVLILNRRHFIIY